MGISRVLVANRGEIAVRIIKACRELDREVVVAVSEADRDSLPSRLANHTVCIGPPKASESYLRIDAIIAAALGTGCDAIHPGYGFLAEHPELPEACEKQKIKFIGPNSENIRGMGNKLRARAMVESYGVPVVPGSEKVRSFREATELAREIGFPVLLKAAAGGGGRGIKIVSDPKEFQNAFETAAAEAGAAFGDATLYIERYIPNARHVEVQVLGDRFGNVIHLGERDCSLQRRYQKVVEEAPAPFLSDSIRQELHSAGATIAKRMRYENAGTIEFIVDQDRDKYYFLEMNTRIQVEHPVTEMITGIDLVKEQIRVADGRPLAFSQSDVRFTGHSLECRITAESAENGFRPSPGLIIRWLPPTGPGVRLDSHCFAGYTVPPFYDSLLAKLIVHGKNRIGAVGRMQEALAGFEVSGIATTLPFLRSLVCQLDYIQGKINTRWIEERLDSLIPPAEEVAL
jgi:acetyl-CoA carboxylase biotin carboxylase subunit